MGDDPFRPRSSGGKRVIMGTKALKAKLIEKKKENRSETIEGAIRPL